jgi:hypothetical protein
MNDRIRLSDDDRERAVQRLHTAIAEGRITVEEFDQRLDQVYRAKIGTDLLPVFDDLPADPPTDPPAAPAGPLTGPKRVSGAILGIARHQDRWLVPPKLTTFAVLGGVVLDLRDASFAEEETVVRAYGVLGRLKVVVPEGVEVRLDDEVVAEGGDGRRVRIVGGGGIGGFTSVEVAREYTQQVPPPSRRRHLNWWVIRLR